MLPRRVFPWLFVLSLLFAQAAAFAHSIGHLHANDSVLPDKVCEVCIAQAHLGSAAPQPLFSPPSVSCDPVGLPGAVLPPVGFIALSAQARAPPASV